MVCEVLDIVPPFSADETLTDFDALPEGLLVVNDTEPLALQVMKMFGLGVPLVKVLLVPVITPPVMLHDIEVLWLQLPLIVYW